MAAISGTFVSHNFAVFLFKNYSGFSMRQRIKAETDRQAGGLADTL